MGELPQNKKREKICTHLNYKKVYYSPIFKSKVSWAAKGMCRVA